MISRKEEMKMNRINQKALVKVMAVSAITFVFGYFARPSLGEIGDSPLEAYFLPYNTEIEGAIGTEYASDYYTVIVPATGRLIVSLYDININHSNEELHIYLIRTTQNSVGTGYTTYVHTVAQSTNPYTTPEIIDIPDLARGIYFVEVRPYRSGEWGGADYKIKAEFTVFPPVVKDDIGDEKKYALLTTNQLPTICTLSGSNDVDYFECHLPYNSNLTLSLTGISAGANVDMEVYTAWDTLIGSATTPGAADETLYLQDLVPGQYFIRIFGEGTTQYTFTVTQEFAKASDILDDVGNDLAHAMPLIPGNPSIFCLQPYNTDIDVFSIYQPEDGPVTVDVYNMFVWAGNEDLYVRILDEYGNIVAQSDNERLVPEQIEVSLSRGQYFVAVYAERSGDFNGAIYTINVETFGSDVGDAFNQAMQIHAIPYGSETYGYPYIGMIDRPGDEDFFQVLLKDDDGFIYLEVDRMLHSNVDVQLFDAYHSLLKTSAKLDTNSESIYEDNLDAGVYFIRVYSPDDGTGQYRLTPTIGTLTSPISDDIGDDYSEAFPLVPYRRVNGYLWNDNTTDCFKFTLESLNELVRIHVFNQHIWSINEDIMLRIYDESGVEIGSSDNDRLEDELVEFNDLGAGVYYATIIPQRSGNMDPGQYCIVVETDAAPLPSGELSINSDIKGTPGEIIYVPVLLNNSQPPDELSSMSIGVQFNSSILEPLGFSNTGLTLDQWNAQVQYARSPNTISVSMNNFSILKSGELLNLIFKVRSTADVGDTSPLTVLVSTLNGAIVPCTNGLMTVTSF
jgi:hypothetical protein